MATYKHPELLVETDWVKENLGKPGIKLVEVDVDTKAYEAGHIQGAVGFNWQTQLQDQLTRDIITKEKFEKLVGDAGITLDGTMNISLIKDFGPDSAAPDKFQVLTFDKHYGEFAIMKGLDLGNGLRFDPQYDDAGLTLVTAPGNSPPPPGSNGEPGSRPSASLDNIDEFFSYLGNNQDKSPGPV
jgi:hypothetical protein